VTVNKLAPAGGGAMRQNPISPMPTMAATTSSNRPKIGSPEIRPRDPSWVCGIFAMV
jgi:hypothetical protein